MSYHWEKIMIQYRSSCVPTCVCVCVQQVLQFTIFIVLMYPIISCTIERQRKQKPTFSFWLAILKERCHKNNNAEVSEQLNINSQTRQKWWPVTKWWCLWMHRKPQQILNEQIREPKNVCLARDLSKRKNRVQWGHNESRHTWGEITLYSWKLWPSWS